MRIAVGADEANDLTDKVIEDLGRRGHDLEVFEPEPWPEAARKVGERVASGGADQGVLFCWTGTGTAMAANKVPGVRAALAWEPWIAEGARRWNDANVLVMSFKRTSIEAARAILDAWFAVQAPDPEEAHNIAQLDEIERRYRETAVGGAPGPPDVARRGKSTSGVRPPSFILPHKGGGENRSPGWADTQKDSQKGGADMGSAHDYSSEDVGNIILLEHVNVTVPDQAIATLFYVAGLGFTRDPYMMVSLENMWVNLGEQQFHLPTRGAQVITGHIGVVVPDLLALRERLQAVEGKLAGTRFAWSVEDDYVAVCCPWGNRFQCYAPGPRFGGVRLGMPYVEFLVRPGAAEGIARFYQQVMRAPGAIESDGRAVARIRIGRSQSLLFRETAEEIPPYDGHHIAVYVANFSGPYGFLQEHELMTEDVTNHQFRFQDIVDPDTGDRLAKLEHEVRSLHHPMWGRPLVNREPAQTLRNYVSGRDSLAAVGG